MRVVVTGFSGTPSLASATLNGMSGLVGFTYSSSTNELVTDSAAGVRFSDSPYKSGLNQLIATFTDGTSSLTLTLKVNIVNGVTATPALVDLGTAGNFVILAKAGISTTGSTSIIGDLGVSPVAADSITGFALNLPAAGAFSTSTLVTGKVYASDYAVPTPANLTTAVTDMQNAYTAAGGQASNITELGAGNIGGLTLAPGVYTWSTGVTIPTDLTLSGGANDVWIFQIAQTLTVSPATHIILSGGAQASNIFWVVAGQTTIGTTAVFNGNILDHTAIVLTTGATLNGRALAQTAVTLDANAVTVPTSGAPAALNPAKAITAFSFPSAAGVINEASNTIAVNVPSGTDVTTLVATFTATGTAVNIGATAQTSGATVNDFTTPQTYTVVADDGTTQDYTVTVTVLPANQIPAAPTVSVDTIEKEVVVNSDVATAITVPLDVLDATVNVSSLTTNDGTNISATLPAITLNVTTSLSTTAVNVAIPDGTVITAPSGSSWNGVINVPQVQTNSSVTVTPDSGNTATVASVIEVGYGDVPLTFDRAVRILIPGQAGNSVGYSRSGVFTQITDVCTADTQAAGDALAAAGNCKINVGSDLVVWTKHFTKFVTYAQAAIPVINSGGGGGGGGGSYAPVNSCSNVIYGAWGSCVNGTQYRNALIQTPSSCSLTAAQQLAESQSCTVSVAPAFTPSSVAPVVQAVLGIKVYTNGTLLRTPDNKIYVVTNGKLQHIATLAELKKYAGQEILKVSSDVVSSYGQAVLGAKVYANGSLIRGADKKVYVITNGKKVLIANLAQLKKYAGKPINNVSNAVLSQY